MMLMMILMMTKTKAKMRWIFWCQVCQTQRNGIQKNTKRRLFVRSWVLPSLCETKRITQNEMR